MGRGSFRNRTDPQMTLSSERPYEGRVLLITGASRGIGAEAAKIGAKRGYAVCVNYSQDEAGAAAVVSAIEAEGGRAIAVRADTSDETDVARMFETVDRELGAVTDLVNNAGLMGGSYRVAELDTDVLRRLMDVNVIGYFLCCREAIRRMSTAYGGKGGRIVNVSSIAAVNGSVGERVHYAASKGAVNSMTIGLSREVAREGINVNVFSPGLTRTTMNPPGRIEKIEHTIPIGRAGTAEEMARGILWLLSDDAAYAVGANLVLSGGR